jgi:hypothetical protein
VENAGDMCAKECKEGREVGWGIIAGQEHLL